MAITSIPLGAHLPCYSRDLPRLLCGLLGWSAFSVPWVSLAWVGFVKKRSWQSLRLSHRHLLPLVVATQGLAANLVRDGGCSTTCSKSEALAANPHRLLACRHLLVHLLPAHNHSSLSSLSSLSISFSLKPHFLLCVSHTRSRIPICFLQLYKNLESVR